MKPTRALTLVFASLAALVGAYLVSIYAIAHGRTLWVSGFNITFSLPVVALILVVLALPIYRYRKALLDRAKTTAQATKAGQPINVGATGAAPKRVDPFYAVRVVLLAKATSVASALFVGWHIGVMLVQFNAPVLVFGFWQNLFTAVGALVAMAIALWVEYICRITDDGENQPGSQPVKTSAIDAALPKSPSAKVRRN